MSNGRTDDKPVSLYRRSILALAGGALATTSGCLARLGFGDSGAPDNSGKNSTNESGDRNFSSPDGKGNASSRNDSGQGQSRDSNATENQSANETEEEYPEAANPEPADNRPNESAYNESGNTSQSSEPTADDITINKHELTTDSSGATVEIVLTNDWQDVIDVIDLEVVFLEDETALTTVTWGTNDLAPGEKWSYQFRAEGKEYSTTNDYDVYIANLQ